VSANDSTDFQAKFLNSAQGLKVPGKEQQNYQKNLLKTVDCHLNGVGKSSEISAKMYCICS